jgi:hypothetical protein
MIEGVGKTKSVTFSHEIFKIWIIHLSGMQTGLHTALGEKKI